MFKRYDIELKLVRIKKSSHDGGIIYDCISEKEYGGLTNWTLQPPSIPRPRIILILAFRNIW